MLKELMKALGGKEAVKPEAEGAAVVIDAAAELSALRTEFEAFKQTAEELAAHEQEVIAALSAELEKTKAALAAATAATNSAEADAAALVADAEAKRLAARKQVIVAAIGTEKADGLMTATENLDDAAFQAVVSALAGSVAAEADTALFKEVGATVEVNAGKVEESAEMRILKAKYGKK